MATRFEETADELVAMLAVRRDDPASWAPINEVLREITRQALDARRGATLPPGAQLLAAWDPEMLAERLRAALPQAEGAGFARADRMIPLGGPLPSVLLAALLMLGLAVTACDSGAGGSSTASGGASGAVMGGQGGHAGAAATAGGTHAGGGGGQTSGTAGAGGAASTGCAANAQSGIWAAIDGSTLSAADKTALHNCLVDLKASWCEGLTQLFASGTEAEIASTLQELVFCCNVRNPGLEMEWTLAYQKLLAGMLCPVVLYKGVSFPD